MLKEKHVFNSEPFSYLEINNQNPIPLLMPQYLKSSDGIDLAYYHQKTISKPIATIIFIHGAGAHCFSQSYQTIGFKLSKNGNIETYFLDLRGHGHSGGIRGGTPNPIQSWNDIKTIIQHAKQKEKHIPIILCGHSAGAGITINYATWRNRIETDGYIIIAPYLGYRSKSSRKNVFQDSFARPIISSFIINRLSFGYFAGNKKAVIYNYSNDKLQKDPLLIGSISCNTSIACTLWNPKKQFSKINKPIGLYIGSKDELFDFQKVKTFMSYLKQGIANSSESIILSGQRHLSILVNIDKNIEHFIKERILPNY